MTFEEFCWVSKVCFGYALFCLSNGVSPLLNNQLDLLCSVKIERSGTKEQSRRLPSQILFSEREVYRKSHNACSHLCNKRKMNLLNILKLKSRNLSKSHATCHCVIPHPLSQKLFHLRSWLAVKRSYFYFSSFYGKLRSPYFRFCWRTCIRFAWGKDQGHFETYPLIYWESKKNYLIIDFAQGQV